VVAYRLDGRDKLRLHLLRDRLESEGILKEGEPLEDRLWTWPEVSSCRAPGQRAPLCNRNWQSQHELKDKRWGFCQGDQKTCKLPQSITLDTLSLARLVDGFFPNDWELDGEPISRERFMVLQKEHDVLKTFLLDALLERAELKLELEGVPDCHDDDKFGTYLSLLYQEARQLYGLAQDFVKDAPDWYLEELRLKRELNVAMIEASGTGLSAEEHLDRDARVQALMDQLKGLHGD
jgi:hypothetical protein